MTTLNDIYTAVVRRALSDMREEYDTLGANIAANATSFTLTAGQTLGSIQPGAIVQIDWELFFITSATSPSSISCIPAFYDSTTAAHTSGALITVNPRFPAVDVVLAINQTLDSLSGPDNGLFQVRDCTLTFNPVIVGYDFTDVNTSISVPSANIIRLLEARAHEYGPFEIWPKVPPSLYKLDRNADTSIFPSGVSFKLYHYAYPGMPIRVAYAAPFLINSSQVYTPLANMTDNIQTVSGLPQQANDILEMGAQLRLMRPREFKRTFTEDQPQPRIATEVPVGASLEALKGVEMEFTERVAEERSRLNNQWPICLR